MTAMLLHFSVNPMNKPSLGFLSCYETELNTRAILAKAIEPS